MKCLIVFLIFIIWDKAHAQQFIKLNQNKSLQKLAVFSEKLHQKPVIQVDDSTILFSMHDLLQRHYDLNLHFDRSGKCDIETHIWDCDSCFQKELEQQLKKTSLHWVKISNASYLSKAKKYLLLEKNSTLPFSFIIRRI